MYTRTAASLEYVMVPIAVKVSGTLFDPTADSVAMAFTAEGVDPVSGDWNTGSWETDATQFEPIYYARCLVGPGGTIALAAAVFDCYVKVTDSPEVPVLAAGQIRVT